MSYQVFEAVFLPKHVLKQIILLLSMEVGVVTISQLHGLVQHYIVGCFSPKTRRIRHMQQAQRNAATQDEWMELAEEMDKIQGHDLWRLENGQTTLFEPHRITSRIDEFVHLMRRNDLFELMFVLRGGIGRHKFGLLQPGLFTKALAGTKVLVESYHHCVCQALDFVCDAPDRVGEDEEPIPTEARLAFFNETRHAYGRTALLLSGGAALGFYHVGVVRGLMANNLMPRVIGGSSAGSIVCAMIGTRTDAECTQDLFEVRGTTAPGHSGKICTNFFRAVGGIEETDLSQQQLQRPKYNGNKENGWLFSAFGEVYYNTAGAFHDMKRTLQGFMPFHVRRFSAFCYDVLTGHRRPQDVFKSDTEHFRDVVRANVGDFTFQEAFDRTGRILNIVVTPNNASDPPRLLNYLTAPHVMVWSAAVASSSLPGVFEANRLVVKEADGYERYESNGGGSVGADGVATRSTKFSDGSMEQDLPMQQLSEMFNVNHFIISQANPHAVLFASYSHKSNVWTNPLTGAVYSILKFLKDQVRSWLDHLVECITAGRFTTRYEGLVSTQFFTQEYEGRPTDISLIPWLNHRSLFSALMHIIYNPCEDEFREWVLAAERETWSYIPAIKSHIAEEVTLDRCVQRLRRRLLEESWRKHRLISSSTGEKMGDRVPSFFISPSLVNLGGHGISDQPTSDNLRPHPSSQHYQPAATTESSSAQDQADVAATPQVANRKTSFGMAPRVDEATSGWNGLGLRGNRSNGNLNRSGSDASGLFIDEEHHQPLAVRPPPPPPDHQQSPGEHTDAATSSWPPSSVSTTAPYMKTSSMAKFYYRRVVPKEEQTQKDIQQPGLRKASSDSFMTPGDSTAENDAMSSLVARPNVQVGTVAPQTSLPRPALYDTRRRSKSYTVLSESSMAIVEEATEERSLVEPLKVTWEPLKG
jgi:TAG lipase / steryl ester hydrolase / phospholipase A2 / LPA acyltransferase